VGTIGKKDMWCCWRCESKKDNDPPLSLTDNPRRRNHASVAVAREAYTLRIVLSIVVAASVTFAVVSACGGSRGSAQQSTSASRGSWTPNLAQGDFADQIDIGGGRKLYLECRGAGSPTVILESGYHDSSQPWSLSDGFPPAVLPGVAAFTKICAYDRPGTLLYTDPPRITDSSSPVQMPRTAQDVISDLHALLGAAKVPGPYILVARSLGGLFMRLYAQSYPDQVRGLVLVDGFPTELPALFGSQWPAYREVLNYPLPQFANNPDFEQIDVDASISQLAKAPALRRMPLVVLTKTKPFARPPSLSGFAFAELERLWPEAARDLVKLEPDTPHIFATGSDHYIQIHQPDLVIQSVGLVIERATQGK
jgi:pimeloyl-ACP methyl ester carboxylesterase